MSLSSLQKWHFNDYMAFHCLVVQNLCSQFSICRHQGGFLVFMIINDAAMNILVQEIFIWVSDNVPRRNPQPGNYSLSSAVCYLSPYRCSGEVSGSCQPLNWWPLLSPLRPGWENEDLLFMPGRNAKGSHRKPP